MMAQSYEVVVGIDMKLSKPSELAKASLPLKFGRRRAAPNCPLYFACDMVV
jgi:hypothetical protein